MDDRSMKKKAVSVGREGLDRVLQTTIEMLQGMGVDVDMAPSTACDAIRPLPARQRRSRETIARLLDAAEEVLAEKGYEATTVPAIAKKAGLSVGVVYRRFPDKDALIRAVWGRFFACSVKRSRRWLEQHGVPPDDFEGAVRWLVASLLSQYRKHRRILRALAMYTRTHTDPDFIAQAEAMNAESLRLTGMLLLPHRDRIRHGDAEKAVQYGLFFVTMVIREILLSRPESYRSMKIDENDLEDELTRMLLGYLSADVVG